LPGNRRLPLPPDETVERLCLLLENGVQLDVASKAVELEPELVEAWIARGRRGGKGQAVFIRFARKVEKARATAETTLVTNVRKAAQNGSWQAAAWLLERGFDWTRKSIQGGEETPGSQVNADPFADLDKHPNVSPIRRRARGG
jgi:hypothetical protein